MGKMIFFRTFQARIITFILLIIVLPFFAITSYSSKSLEKMIYSKVGDSLANTLETKIAYIEDIIDNLINATTFFCLDDKVVNILANPKKYSDYEMVSYIDSVMKSVSNTYLRKFTSNIMLTDIKGNIYTSWPRRANEFDVISKNDWFQKILDARGEYLCIYHKLTYSGMDEAYSGSVFSIGRVVTGMYANESYGMVMVGIKEEEFLKFLKEKYRYSDYEIAIVDYKTGEYVTGSKEDADTAAFLRDFYEEKKGNLTFGRTYIEKINNNKYIINYQNIRKTNLGVIQLVKHNSIFGEIERIKAVDTLIILLATAIFTVLTIIVSFKMTKPLKQLKKEMGAINDENLGHLIPEKGHDDVSELIKAYNSMVVRMRDLFEKIRYEQKQKEEIRYRFLQSQINPHFIFNTLNNIKWVAYMSQADKVGEMLSALGLLMEASIGKGEDIIILSEEIRYIDNYIYLQKLRYGDKIDVKYYIPDEILFCSVVKLMLQPLIENSIFHGFSNLKRKGLIKINARREDHDLILIVSDNGNGMDGQKLEEVRKTLEQSEYIKPAQKVGLYNVHQRIRLECGSRYGLEIQSILKSGTRVKIRLPYRNMRDIEDVGNVRGIKEIEGAAGIEYGDKEDIENIEGMENKSDVVEVEDLDDKSVDS